MTALDISISLVDEPKLKLRKGVALVKSQLRRLPATIEKDDTSEQVK
jgi:hypothetical protein